LIRKRLAACRCEIDSAITARFRRAKEEGELPPSASPEDLTRYLSTVIQGLSIQSANGASKAELMRVADTALVAFDRR
jgi:hypothetical protein